MGKPVRNRPAKIERQSHGLKAAGPIEHRKTKYIAVFILVGVFAGIPFFLGKYFEFNSPDPFDSGGYVYSAKHVLSGARIGFEEKPSAQTGTLLLNMLGVWAFGFNETGPKLLQAIFQITAFVLMFIAIRRLFGQGAAAVSVIVASVYLSAPLIAKFGNVKEQFMIAFMIMGISCFVLYQLSGKWWFALLTGGLLVWGPMFKQTGLSAIAATWLFVLAQPFLGHRKWGQTGKDILLLVAGAVISMSPIYIWLIGSKTPLHYWPYSFVLEPAVTMLGGSSEVAVDKTQIGAERTADENAQKKVGLWRKLLPGYVTDSWDVLGPAERRETRFRVFRYYGLLILPIALALGSIVMRVGRWILERRVGRQKGELRPAERFVLLFGVWWFFDMAFVWISPHSYEQYYLPLNASAAMLGGYIVGLYWDKATTVANRRNWVLAGVAGVVIMAAMSWHIFFGIAKSPHSGTPYTRRARGYAQKLEEVHKRHTENARGAWEFIGEYIRGHSQPSDVIYVWGWFPGIYVSAQRFSPLAKAFEGTMHTLPPASLAKEVEDILAAFSKHQPKFIVDSRKSHFPFNRPPLELWPQTQKGFVPAEKKFMDEYDAAYSKLLREKIGPDEAQRYEVMRPFREYVMSNYVIVDKFPYSPHVLFVRKGTQ